jgi:hypothetical protein
MQKNESIFNNLKKETPFRVSEQYFDTLSGKIMDSVLLPDQQQSAKKNKSVRLKHVFAYAASFLGLIFLSYLGIHFFGLLRNENYISNNDAIEYVNFYTSDFDEVTIMVNLPDRKNANNSVNDAETESIISYLVEEGIDELTIYSKL